MSIYLQNADLGGYAIYRQNQPDVATSGSYNDLSGKSLIYPFTYKAPTFSGYAQSADLANVATSGSYNDLTSKPDLSVYLQSADLGGYAQTADLADIATSGSYNDLNSKPDLSVYLQSADLGMHKRRSYLMLPLLGPIMTSTASLICPFTYKTPTLAVTHSQPI